MSRMHGFIGGLLCAAAFFPSTCALADKTISTVSDWDGATYVDPFGYPNSATYGQSFTAPIYNPVLTSFTFYLEPIKTGSNVGYTAYVYQWDKTSHTAIGTPLFTSAPMSTSGLPAHRFTAVTINTGDLSLTPHGYYIAFLSASSSDQSNVTDPVNMGFLGPDLWGADKYAGGGFYYLDNGSDTSQFTSGPWLDAVGHGEDDLAFQMTFTKETTTAVSSVRSSRIGVESNSPDTGLSDDQDWAALPAVPEPPEAGPAERRQQLGDPYSDWGVGIQLGTGQTVLEPPAYLTGSASAQPDVVLSSLGSRWGDGLSPELQGLLEQSEAPGEGPPASFAGFVRRFNTTDFPYTTVCKLRMTFTVNGETKVYGGSGVLIAAKYVLTAAHNIIDKAEGVATSVQVKPGLNGTEEPFGVTNAVFVHTVLGWTNDENYDADMALLTLANNAGNTGWMGLSSFYDNGQVGNLAGYPGYQDSGLGQYWKSGATSPLPASSVHRIMYPMNGPPGMSGGPVYKTDPNDVFLVFAVHSTHTPPIGSNGIGKGCRVDPIKYNAIESWINGG